MISATTFAAGVFVGILIMYVAYFVFRPERRTHTAMEELELRNRTLEKKVSEQRKKLGEESGRLSAILSSMTEAVIAFGKHGRVVLMNQAAATLLRIAPETAFGQDVEKIAPFSREDKKMHGKEYPIGLAREHGVIITKVTDDYYVFDSRGRRIPVVFSAAILVGKEVTGDVEGVLIIRDVTEEKEIDRAKTEFVSLASHQLRTPLSTVNWYTEMLLAGDAGPVSEDQRRYLEEVYHGNQRMVELVNALLNVSRLELGTFAVDPSVVDIRSVVQSVVEEQALFAKNKNLTLGTNIENSVPERITTDPKLVRMVLQNLLSNAIKYTPSGGTVKIEIMKDSSGRQPHHLPAGILIRVADTGLGIPEKDYDKIFSKLFRADNVRETDAEGTGLGLYIAKSIVEHLGGAIWFDSEEKAGTIFYVTLPLRLLDKQRDSRKLQL